MIEIDKEIARDVFENIFKKEHAIYEYISHEDQTATDDGYTLFIGNCCHWEIYDEAGDHDEAYFEAYQDLLSDTIVGIDDSVDVHNNMPFVLDRYDWPTDVRIDDEALIELYYTADKDVRDSLIERCVETCEMLGLELMTRPIVKYCREAMRTMEGARL